MTDANADLTQPVAPEGDDRSGGIVGGLMLWVAARCTLQYIVLPFILPLAGVSGSLSVWLSAAISLFALGLIVFNLRRLWRTNWRWRYLALSLASGSAIALFLVLDIQELMGGR